MDEEAFKQSNETIDEYLYALNRMIEQLSDQEASKESLKAIMGWFNHEYDFEPSASAS